MISYEEYSPHFHAGTIELLRHLWQCSDSEEARELFVWRYLDNPRTESPCVFVALDGGKVVGLRCYVVQRFARGADDFLVACAADAIVHPDYRRRAIISRLTLLALERLAARDIGVVLNLSANRASAAVARKLGWQELGATRYMYRAGLLEGLGGGLMPGSRARLSTLEVSSAADGEPPRCRYPLIGDQRLSCVRDRAFYAWRYRQPSTRFHRISARDGDLNAYLILKQTSRRMFSVMEYGCDAPHMLPQMVRGFVVAHGGWCVLRLLTLTREEGEVALFRQAGFFFEPRRLIRLLGKHRTGALVRTTSSDARAAELVPPVNLADERSWYIRPADVH